MYIESKGCNLMLINEIGQRLKDIRKKNGYTQEEFSELMGMSLNYYGKIERGEGRLSIEKLIFLHEKMNVDLNFLLTGNKNQAMDFYSVLADCPKEKVFDFEQLIRYAQNLYR